MPTRILRMTALATALTAGCSKTDAVDGKGEAPGGPPAYVDGEPLPRTPFDREVEAVLARYEKASRSIDPTLRAKVEREVAERMVETALFEKQAKEFGVELTDEMLARRWKTEVLRYGTEEALRSYLDRTGTSEAELRARLRQELLREKVLARVSERVSLDESEVRSYYETHPEEFVEPAQVHLSHVLIRASVEGPEDEVAAARKRAERLRARIRSGKATFEEVARTHSEDVSKAKGGDLGWIAEDRLGSALRKAVASLDGGEISDVVRTPDGFHIVRKLGERPARKLTLDAVKATLRAHLAAKRKKEAVGSALERWREEAEVRILVGGRSEEPTPGEQPIPREGPSSGDEPSPGEQPDSREEPSSGDEPTPVEQPIPREEPSSGDEPRPGEQPNPREGPAPGETSPLPSHPPDRLPEPVSNPSPGPKGPAPGPRTGPPKM